MRIKQHLTKADAQRVHARERFRHLSYISAVATGVIVGLGTQGYELAIQAVAARAGKT